MIAINKLTNLFFDFSLEILPFITELFVKRK